LESFPTFPLRESQGVKGHVIFFPHEEKEVISRNVVFDELRPGGDLLPDQTEADAMKPQVIDVDLLPLDTQDEPLLPDDVARPNTLTDETQVPTTDNSSSTSDPPRWSDEQWSAFLQDPSRFHRIDEALDQKLPSVNRRRRLPPSARHFFSALCTLADRLQELPQVTKEELRTMKAKDVPVPRNEREAATGRFRDLWEAAKKEEIDTLKTMKTFQGITQLPAGRRAISTRFVFSVKSNPDGTVERLKARLVVRGFNMIPGVEFNDTWSPVGKGTSLRILLQVAVALGIDVHAVDVKNAYTNAVMIEEIYVRLPDGSISKLAKALYGTKQAGRYWYFHVRKVLEDAGYKSATNDPAVFIKSVEHTKYAVILLYVDDMLL